jgi:hypothetical protein
MGRLVNGCSSEMFTHTRARSPWRDPTRRWPHTHTAHTAHIHLRAFPFANGRTCTLAPLAGGRAEQMYPLRSHRCRWYSLRSLQVKGMSEVFTRCVPPHPGVSSVAGFSLMAIKSENVLGETTSPFFFIVPRPPPRNSTASSTGL